MNPPPVMPLGVAVSELMERGGAASAGEAAFADGLGTLARAIQANLSEEVHSLDFIVSAAVELIPGAESAGVSTQAAKNRLAGQSASGPLVGPVLEAQNETGDGPCLDVVSGADQLLVADLAVDDRWRAFADAVAAAGVRSMLCTPLTGEGNIRGSLTVMSTRPGVFDDESRELARVFAAHASIALAGAARHRNIVAALGSRDVIGQAKGILMERFGITADAAFAVLLRMSQHLNRKLRDVSAELCSTGILPGGPELQRGRSGAPSRTASSAGGASTAGAAADAVAAGSTDADVMVEAAIATPQDRSGSA